jgi:hypothetical protein
MGPTRAATWKHRAPADGTVAPPAVRVRGRVISVRATPFG